MKRFSVNGHNVLDKHTGLMWTKNAGLTGFPMSWQEALGVIKELNASVLYGYNDWKLPNRNELFSIVSHDAVNPSLPQGHPFENIFTGYYWTSTTCRRLPCQAWYIHMGGARVFKGMKYASYMVWPVRIESGKTTIFQTGQKKCFDEFGNTVCCDDTGQDGEFQAGEAWPEPRFIPTENTVEDRLTGLIWLKNANIGETTLAWTDACRFVETMNSNNAYGFNDWRMPRIREFESLTDMEAHTPAMPIGHPFTDVRDYYWSSTASKYDIDYAWVMYMIDGAVGVGYKPYSDFFVWPVRGNCFPSNPR